MRYAVQTREEASAQHRAPRRSRVFLTVTLPFRKVLAAESSEAELTGDFVFQMVSSDGSPLSFLPAEAQAQASPPPPYPAPQELPQPLLQQPPPQGPSARPPAASSLQQPDFQLLAAQVSPSRCGGNADFSVTSQLNDPPVPEGFIFDQLLPRCELRPAALEARPSLYAAGE